MLQCSMRLHSLHGCSKKFALSLAVLRLAVALVCICMVMAGSGIAVLAYQVYAGDREHSGFF